MQDNINHQRASEPRQLPSIGLDEILENNGAANLTIPTPHTVRIPTLGSSEENQILMQHTEENLLDDHSLERQIGEAPFADEEDEGDIDFDN